MARGKDGELDDLVRQIEQLGDQQVQHQQEAEALRTKVTKLEAIKAKVFPRFIALFFQPPQFFFHFFFSKVPSRCRREHRHKLTGFDRFFLSYFFCASIAIGKQRPPGADGETAQFQSE